MWLAVGHTCNAPAPPTPHPIHPCSSVGDATAPPAASGGGSGGPPAAPPLAGPDSGFFRAVCTNYVLHHLETLTGYRFVLTTDAAAGDMFNALRHIYSELFVGHALKNPMYTPGTPVSSTGFVRELDSYLRAHPGFAVRVSS